MKYLKAERWMGVMNILIIATISALLIAPENISLWLGLLFMTISAFVMHVKAMPKD